MNVSSPSIDSGTPAPPRARPHCPCARTGISRFEAARGRTLTTLFAMIFTFTGPVRRQGPSYQATRRVSQARRNPIGRARRAETFPPHSDQYARKQLPFQTTAA